MFTKKTLLQGRVKQPSILAFSTIAVATSLISAMPTKAQIAPPPPVGLGTCNWNGLDVSGSTNCGGAFTDPSNDVSSGGNPMLGWLNDDLFGFGADPTMPWVYGGKYDDTGFDEGSDLLGFSATGFAGGTSGTYEFNPTNTTLDLGDYKVVISLKDGDPTFAPYLIDPAVASGNWNMNAFRNYQTDSSGPVYGAANCNVSGPGQKFPDTYGSLDLCVDLSQGTKENSHISYFYMNKGVTETPVIEIPEPNMLIGLGIFAASMAASRRRKSN